jgi:type IV pilus secretin PilQ/predicted competence protein
VAISAGLAAAATLTGMSVSTEGEVTRIHVMLDEPVEFSQFALSDPARLYVDCRGVSAILPKSLPAGTGRAGAIQASVWDGEGHHAMTRITIDLAQASDTEVTEVTGGLLVVLSPVESSQWTTEAPAPAADPEAMTPAEAMETTEPADPPAATETAEDASPETPSATEPAPETAPEAAADAEEATPEAAPVETAPATDTKLGETPAGTPPAGTPQDAVPTLEELQGLDPSFSLDEEPTDEAALDADTDSETEEAPAYTLPEDELLQKYTGRREPTVTTFNMSGTRSLAGRSGARVSLDIQGADIYTVLRSISEYSGVNIVMGYDVKEEIKNPLSFHLENVPWGEALEMVLRSAHLWYREEGNIIRVDTEENLRNEELQRTHAARQLEDVMPLITRIVEVIYAHARELKPAVEKSLSKRGVVEVDERTNSMLITDIASRVEAAVQMIQHLDSQTPQVEIVAKMVDVDSRFVRELGVLWTGSGFGGEVTANDVILGANNIIDPTANVRFGIVKSWGEVNALLSAMEQENKANIISNPRVTTVNNRQARILVGKKIPLIVLDEAGNAVTELVTIGITLLVTPHINDNNRITLDLHPEVSDLASQATVQGGVIINTSEADTRVMVENNQTAVIAGLIRANDTILERGVPILKDIPLLGSFFKSTGKVREKRELLIFVTPRIVTSLVSQED